MALADTTSDTEVAGTVTRQTYTTKEVSVKTGIPVRQLQKYVRQGNLPAPLVCRKFGQKHFWPSAAVDAWLAIGIQDEQEAPPAA